MKVLVINVGSTSIKYQLYQMDTEEILAGGVVERVGSLQALHKWRAGPTRAQTEISAPTMRSGLEAVLAQLTGPSGALKDISELRAVGHRVVHGGEKLVHPCVITPEVKEIIARCAQFAPIHNPANLAGIEAAQAALPHATHVAVFDTAFHGELPPHAYTLRGARTSCTWSAACAATASTARATSSWRCQRRGVPEDGPVAAQAHHLPPRRRRARRARSTAAARSTPRWA